MQAVHFSEMWTDNYHAAQLHEDSLGYDRRCTKFVTRVLYACANQAKREEVGFVFKDRDLDIVHDTYEK
jgi:hypothetical protein